MPRENHTPPKQIRIPDHDWERLEQTVGKRHRAAVVVALIRWYNRERGAKLPKRPDQHHSPGLSEPPKGRVGVNGPDTGR